MDEHAVAAVERLRAIEDIKVLKARYFRLLDTKDWTAWEELFDEQCEMRVGRSGPLIVGRQAWVDTVVRGLAGTRTVHNGSMPEITITGPREAEGTWVMTDYVDNPDAPERSFRGYGHYFEQYVRSDDKGWLIKKLELRYLRRDAL
jgi:hypothetical protein